MATARDGRTARGDLGIPVYPWMDGIACKGEDVTIFFSGGVGATERALGLCRRCEVSADCLDAAMTEERRSSYRAGIRGGMTPEGRSRLVKNGYRARKAALEALGDGG